MVPKNRAPAVEPSTAAGPPAKRGRPTKAEKEMAVAASSPGPTPAKRGRPSKTETNESTAAGQKANATPPAKKVKPNTSATRRSSKRISDKDLGPRVTRQAVNAGSSASKGQTNGSAVAVKQVKAKAKGKGRASAKQLAKPATESEVASGGPKASKKANGRKAVPRPSDSNNVSVKISPTEDDSSGDEKEDDNAQDDGSNHWFVKAEDDLHVDTVVAMSDGGRNATTRDNMRLMLKGDLAFLYLSGGETPGIAGRLEVVKEHYPDDTAIATVNNKWCKVDVKLVQKFPERITLKELQKYGKKGGTLQAMQALTHHHLRVTKVTKKEWDFIMDLVEEEDEDMPAPAPMAPMMNTATESPSGVEVADTPSESLGTAGASSE